MMKVAVLADVHGNLPALEATIGALEELQPDHVVLNGDMINAVPFSADVVELVRNTDWLTIRGNHEFYYLDWGTERATPGSKDPERWGQLHWLMGQITDQQGAFLATLPDERTLYLPCTQPLCIAHGVPGRNRVGFYDHQPESKIAMEIDHVRERTLVSAHTHVQIDRQISFFTDMSDMLESDPHINALPASLTPRVQRQWHLINPGSVGLPLNGDPRAQFAVLESVADDLEWGGWRATYHRVEYDRRPALAAYEESGMLEAGGVMSQLFYWELVTSEPEIILFYRWAYGRNLNPDTAPSETFQAYLDATGRAAVCCRARSAQQ